MRFYSTLTADRRIKVVPLDALKSDGEADEVAPDAAAEMTTDNGGDGAPAISVDLRTILGGCGPPRGAAPDAGPDADTERRVRGRGTVLFGKAPVRSVFDRLGKVKED